MTQVRDAQLNELTPDAHNANKGTERGRYMLDHSLRQYGAGRSILVDKHGRILAGNKTVEAAADIGLDDVVIVHSDGTKLIVVQRDDLDLDDGDDKARLMAYADNRTGQFMEWDADALKLDLDAGLDLSDMFRDEELIDLGALTVEPPADPGPQVDRAAELQEKWQVQRGQVWEVGRHRVMCGDSTSAEDVGRLMGGERADACISDPPYGMNWSADASRFSGGKFGKQSRGRERDDVVNDDKPFDPEPYLEYPVVVLWGMNHYCDKLPPSGVLVWIKKPDVRFGTFLSDCELAWTNVGHGVYAIRHDWGGITRQSEREDFWHPTQKPVVVVNWTMEQTRAGTAIYDPFLGSGTTLVACEQTGRIGYGMEIEPKYVAVTLERLAGMGLEPRLVQNCEGVTVR